jgi:hypothetical protein
MISSLLSQAQQQVPDCGGLGGDYYAKHDPERALRRITRQANALGLTVRLEPIEAA